MEKKKLLLEYHRVKAAELDLEVRMEEMLVEVERVKKHLEIQKAKVQELDIKIKTLE